MAKSLQIEGALWHGNGYKAGEHYRECGMLAYQEEQCSDALKDSLRRIVPSQEGQWPIVETTVIRIANEMLQAGAEEHQVEEWFAFILAAGVGIV